MSLKNKKLMAKNIQLDATNATAVQNFINYVAQKEKRIDILINAQAINHCVPIENISIAQWGKVLATNLTSIFLMCKACVPHMKKQRYGKIVNISSVAARNRSPVSGVHYVASKSAILGFTRQLAFETAPFGLNVNAVCPGQTETPMLMKSMTPSQRKALAKSIPLRRIADPEEQASVILFLASDTASYMSGAVVDVNGGQI